MRAIAIIMVVGIHSLSYCLPLPITQNKVISFIVQPIPVPLFFLVDGYLFALSISFSKEYNYLKHIQKSIIRLLVPWLIFTLLYLIARYYFELNGYLTDKLIVGRPIKEIIISAYGSVYFAQMYFLISLFLVRLLNPIFKNIIFIKHYAILLILFFCIVMAYNFSAKIIDPLLKIKGGEEPITHALWGVQFYILGIILFKTSAVVKLEKLFFPFLLSFITAMVFHNELLPLYSGRILIQYLYLLSFFFLFAHIGDKLPILDIIGKNTMGIYLVQAPFIINIVSLATNKIILLPLLNYLVISSGTFILSIFVVIAIKKLPYGPVLFGEANRQ